MPYKMPPPRLVAVRFEENTEHRKNKKLKPHSLRKFVGLMLKSHLHLSCRPRKEMVDTWIELVQEELDEMHEPHPPEQQLGQMTLL